MKRFDIADGTIIVSKPDADYETYIRDWLEADEIETAENFASPKRRVEWVEWHRIVRMELGKGQQIEYDRRGAPKFMEPNGELKHLSVSHSKSGVAVMLSKRECGVDIESLDRNFDKVADHYINMQERELAESGDWLFKATVWCAKEAFYKMCGRENNDFLRDMTVRRIDFESGTLYARLYGDRDVTAHYFVIDNQMVCWCMEER